MVTTSGMKMAATIRPARSEGEVVSISGEQLIPLQSLVGFEEGRREGGKKEAASCFNTNQPTEQLMQLSWAQYQLSYQGNSNGQVESKI